MHREVKINIIQASVVMHISSVAVNSYVLSTSSNTLLVETAILELS